MKEMRWKEVGKRGSFFCGSQFDQICESMLRFINFENSWIHVPIFGVVLGERNSRKFKFRNFAIKVLVLVGKDVLVYFANNYGSLNVLLDINSAYLSREIRS
jgi:hypothetical protein